MKVFGIRRLAGAVCLVLLLGLLPPVSASGVLSLASEAAIVMDADTGQVLYEQNIHRQMYPASITKIMTAMLALQNLDSDTPLTVTQTAYDAVSRTSSHIGLLPGEVLTLDEAMHAIAMESANDAANVLAEAVSGSLEAFAQKMTETAHSLGAWNTNFVNANGLPNSSHYTTAYDMALITAAALRVPGLAEYFRTVDYLCPATNLNDARVFSNKDRLLPGGQYAYEGVLMAKTGWTTAAQGTFAAVVRQGDTTLIVITLKSPQLEDKYRDTHKLLDYCFSQFHRVTVTGEEAAGLLPLGRYEPVPEQELSFLLPEGVLPSEICFSLDEGTDLLTESAEQTSVTLCAAVEGALLPSVTLQVQREPGPANSLSLLTRLETVMDYPLQVPIFIGLVLFVLMLLTGKIVGGVRRHRRRRILRNRIQRMKRKMNETGGTADG